MNRGSRTEGGVRTPFTRVRRRTRKARRLSGCPSSKRRSAARGRSGTASVDAPIGSAQVTVWDPGSRSAKLGPHLCCSLVCARVHGKLDRKVESLTTGGRGGIAAVSRHTTPEQRLRRRGTGGGCPEPKHFRVRSQRLSGRPRRRSSSLCRGPGVTSVKAVLHGQRVKQVVSGLLCAPQRENEFSEPRERRARGRLL
jgi:hypothetical protein